MQEICVSSGSYILIDTEVVQWWLDENGIDVTLAEADEIVDCIYRRVIANVHDLAVAAHHDLFEKEQR